MLMGSNAQQVLRHSGGPLLVLKAEAEASRSPRLRNLLVLLNGEREGQAILPYAAELALAYNAGIHLLIVVPTAGTMRGDLAVAARMSPLATSAVLDLEQDRAADYLQEVAADLTARGVQVTAQVARGDVQQEVVTVARREDIDLVAMASHGHSGFAALWSSSVGTGVQSRIDKPMLLLNPGADRRG
jgi:nucleotide-binding universal stress UspA family protein